jgi:hypothetical protein
MSRGQSGGYATARCRRSSNRDRPRPYACKCTALKFKFPRGHGPCFVPVITIAVTKACAGHMFYILFPMSELSLSPQRIGGWIY